MLKLLIAACGLALFLSAASAVPTTQATARAEAIDADIDHFTFELKYHGNEDKPHYRLTLSVPYIGERKENSFSPTLQLNAHEAKSIVDHLSTEGFLDNAIGVKEANKKIPEPTGPAYTLTVKTSNLIFTEDLGWSDEMIERLEKMKPVLHGDATPAMDQLLARLQGYRGKWDKPQLDNLDSMKVLKIARGEVEKLKWPLGGIYTLRNKDDEWSILVWRVNGYFKDGKPQFVPGGFRILTIDKEGRVVRNIAGH